jgi:hypothetical protein
VRRVGIFLLAVFLVNLPFVHQTWSDRELAREGIEVAATVVDSQRSGGNYLVDYRLPRSVDPKRTRFSARVDRTTFERARASHVLEVRVVPGKPANNEPSGAVSSNLFVVVALLGDLVLLLFGVVAYRRWRARSRHVVMAVDGDDVTLETTHGTLTVVGPPGWAERVRPGESVGGSLHLASDDEVVSGSSVGGLEQLHGSSYVVRGRVVDARAGRVVLELADRTRLRVETGEHRIRADIREPTEVRGTLCFTPARL